jgi:putative transcriptional regulator
MKPAEQPHAAGSDGALIERRGFADQLWKVRRRLGLSREQFQRRFGVPLATIKDLEQGRAQPSAAMRVLVVAIGRAPEVIASAAAIVRAEPAD